MIMLNARRNIHCLYGILLLQTFLQLSSTKSVFNISTDYVNFITLHEVMLLLSTQKFQPCFQRNVVATLKEVCCEYMDNTPLTHRSPRLELKAIANAVKKIMRAFRSKEFDKLFVVAEPANDVDFVKEVSLLIISLIFVIYFGINIVNFIFNIVFIIFR